MVNKQKQLVFIDDSGDPGFKDISSKIFVLSAILIADEEESKKLDSMIDNYKKELGWDLKHEFKFNKTRKSQKIELLRRSSYFRYDIYVVYSEKEKREKLKDVVFYNMSVEKILKNIPIRNATVYIDGKYDRKYKAQLKSYIRKKLNSKKDRKIKNFIPTESTDNNLIQLADIIAGSINRSFHIEKTDSSDYVKIIKNKIIEIKSLD